jgi:hypothetical protein
MKKISLFTCAAFLLLVSMAQAGAVLHLGSPPNSGTYLYGTEVIPINDTNLGILENGNGNPTLFDPLLLILGVVNQTQHFLLLPSVCQLAQEVFSVMKETSLLQLQATCIVYH